jgi:SNF2 family DNA or RNA helicase
MKSIRIPEGFMLRPYQIEGVKHLLGAQRKLLFDDVGLGKTAQSLVAVNTLGAKTTLVLCPPSTRFGWAREAERWTDRGYKIQVLMKELDKIFDDTNICIVAYSLLNSPAIVDQLKEKRWTVTIIDELHSVKSTKAKRTKNILSRGGVASKSVHLFGLSATPMINGPIDLWPIFRSSGKEHLPTKCRDWMGYTKYFCNRYKDYAGRWNVSGSANLPVLKKALYESGFALRRTKEEVLKELPEKEYRVIPLARGKKSISKDLSQKLLNKNVRLAMGADEMAEARRELGIEKLDVVLDYIKDVPEQAVIFGWHREFLETIHKKTNSSLYYGSMTQKQKEQSKQDFLDGKSQFLIANIQSAGTGLDGLQHAASRCIFAEFPWTYTDIDQASGRLHRMGQKGNVLIDMMCVAGGIEEYMLQTILRKQINFKNAIDLSTKLINI